MVVYGDRILMVMIELMAHEKLQVVLKVKITLRSISLGHLAESRKFLCKVLKSSG